jgi:hypothetical protein
MKCSEESGGEHDLEEHDEILEQWPMHLIKLYGCPWMTQRLHCAETRVRTYAHARRGIIQSRTAFSPRRFIT